MKFLIRYIILFVLFAVLILSPHVNSRSQTINVFSPEDFAIKQHIHLLYSINDNDSILFHAKLAIDEIFISENKQLPFFLRYSTNFVDLFAEKENQEFQKTLNEYISNKLTQFPLFGPELNLFYLTLRETLEQNYDKSENNIKTLLKKEADLPIIFTIHVLLHYSQVKFETSQSKDGFQLLKKCMALAQNEDLLFEKAIVFIHLSKYFGKNGQIDSAKYYLNFPEEYFIQVSNNLHLAQVYNNLGLVYNYEFSYKTALQYFLKSYNLYNALNNSKKLAIILHNIGLSYKLLSRDSLAVQYFNKSLAIDSALHDEMNAAICKLNIAMSYTKMSKYKQAQDVIIGVPKIFKKYGNSYYLYQSYFALSKLKLREKKYDTAIHYLQLCLTEPDTSNFNVSVYFDIYNQLGVSYFYKKHFKKALYYYEKAHQYAERLKNDDYLAISLFNIAEVSGELNQYSKAFTYFMKYHTLQTKIDKKKQKEQTLELQEKYETEKKQRMIEVQKFKIKERTNQRNQAILIAGIIGLLFLIILIIVFIIRYKLKKERIIRAQNNELNRKEIDKIINESETKRIVSQLEGQEKERNRISKNLHDNIGNMLNVLRLNLDGIKDIVPDSETSKFDKVTDIYTEIYSEIRNISHNLDSGKIFRFGLKPALKEFKQSIEKSGKIKFDLHFLGGEYETAKETELDIYRIIQEATTNTLKYAAAQTITVQINYDADENNIILIIEDDGKGFNFKGQEKYMGNGLQNISNRVENLNANIEIDTSPGNGTAIIVSNIPITSKEIN